MRININFTVFCIFFIISMIEVVQLQDWTRVCIWFAIAMIALFSGDTRHRGRI
jgi:hypothetical protein